MRHGQWCMFSCKEPWSQAAHHARNGKVVGIYQAGPPSFIAAVTPSGENLMLNIDGHLLPVQVHVNQPGLVPITDRRDIPSKRLEGMLAINPDWQPQP